MYERYKLKQEKNIVNVNVKNITLKIEKKLNRHYRAKRIVNIHKIRIRKKS